MQPDRRLVEDVANAAQIGAELRGEANALGFAAGQRRRGAVEREITQADEVEKAEPAFELRQHVARNLAFSRLELQLLKVCTRLLHGQRCELADVAVAKTHRERLGFQALTRARLAALRIRLRLGPPRFFARLLLVEVRELDARPIAARAPTVAGVVREQSRVERLEAAAARRARALRREKLALAPLRCFEHTNHVAAERQRLRERIRELPVRGRPDVDLCDRQLDIVLLEPIEPRPALRRRRHAVDAQCRVAAARRPLGKLGVVTLAADDERAQQCHALAAITLHDLRMNRVEALGVDRHVAVRTMLRA